MMTRRLESEVQGPLTVQNSHAHVHFGPFVMWLIQTFYAAKIITKYWGKMSDYEVMKRVKKKKKLL